MRRHPASLTGRLWSEQLQADGLTGPYGITAEEALEAVIECMDDLRTPFVGRRAYTRWRAAKHAREGVANTKQARPSATSILRRLGPWQAVRERARAERQRRRARRRQGR